MHDAPAVDLQAEARVGKIIELAVFVQESFRPEFEMVRIQLLVLVDVLRQCEDGCSFWYKVASIEIVLQYGMWNCYRCNCVPSERFSHHCGDVGEAVNIFKGRQSVAPNRFIDHLLSFAQHLREVHEDDEEDD
jgi:hypothetical protein